MISETQERGLIELQAACDESIRYGGVGWVKTSRLSGTEDDRSAKNIRSLVDLRLAEGRKAGVLPQGQWLFRITERGRDVIAQQESEDEGDSK
jgi:hypothetical protein